jgi:hypothetical protein
MAVVVRDRSSLLVVCVAIIVVLVVAAMLVFLISGGRGTVFVVALPGFPIESIIIGLAAGLFLVALKRRH